MKFQNGIGETKKNAHGDLLRDKEQRSSMLY